MPEEPPVRAGRRGTEGAVREGARAADPRARGPPRHQAGVRAGRLRNSSKHRETPYSSTGDSSTYTSMHRKVVPSSCAAAALRER